MCDYVYQLVLLLAFGCFPILGYSVTQLSFGCGSNSSYLLTITVHISCCANTQVTVLIQCAICHNYHCAINPAAHINQSMCALSATTQPSRQCPTHGLYVYFSGLESSVQIRPPSPIPVCLTGLCGPRGTVITRRCDGGASPIL
jgi:hypothetical protein